MPFNVLHSDRSERDIILYREMGQEISRSKRGLRWVPKANEIDTNNMKCTCPTQGPNARRPNATYIPPVCVGDLRWG